MNPTFQAVLFDLDGTLLDTLADIAKAMNTALEGWGLPTHPVDAYRLMVGSGMQTLVRRAVPEHVRHDDRTIVTIAERVSAEYARHPAEQTRPYDGVSALIAELRDRHSLPLAVLSNKPDELVRTIVARFFGSEDFAVVQGLRDGVPAKPDPTSVLRIAETFAAAPGRIVYLGDSDIDMQTARNAGMYAVGAGWGFRGADELRAAGADAVIMRPGDLHPIVSRGIPQEWGKADE